MAVVRARDPLLDIVTATRHHGSGFYLGAGRSGAVYAPSERGVLVLGPPRAGKTSALVIPNVLGADGPAVVVSTKPDVLEATAAARRRLGACLVFDPSGETPLPNGVQRVGWSPLGSSARWDDAVLMAEAMVGATRPDERAESAHWLERAGALLSCVLHAGALGHLDTRVTCGFVYRREIDPVMRLLAQHHAELALDIGTGIAETDEREQSGIWSTAAGVLSAYRTEAALESAGERALDANRFLDGPHTLFVVAPSERQRQAAPLVAGLIRTLRTAAYRRSRDRERRGPGLRLILDELAQIAPLHDLPALVAEGASQGVLTLACLQDLSQARARWGQIADGFLSLFGVKVILPGIGDVRTLETIATLAGDHDQPVVSTTLARSHAGIRRHRSRATSVRRERRLPPSAIADPTSGRTLALLGARPTFIRLTPYYSTSPWRDVVAQAR
jgi:type IV secretion system protein VirD4